MDEPDDLWGDAYGPGYFPAYVLWLLLGWAGGHRWYLGRGGSAILQLMLVCGGIGLFWWLADVALIPGLIARRRRELRHERLIDAALLRMAARPG